MENWTLSGQLEVLDQAGSHAEFFLGPTPIKQVSGWETYRKIQYYLKRKDLLVNHFFKSF